MIRFILAAIAIATDNMRTFRSAIYGLNKREEKMLLKLVCKEMTPVYFTLEFLNHNGAFFKECAAKICRDTQDPAILIHLARRYGVTPEIVSAMMRTDKKGMASFQLARNFKLSSQEIIDLQGHVYRINQQSGDFELSFLFWKEVFGSSAEHFGKSNIVGGETK